MSLKIGPVSLDSPVILAPMSGVTDMPFRRLVKSCGVGLVVSEMIASKAMIHAAKKTVLTVTTFAVIGGLLWAHFKTGLRGRKAARIVLLAYLLLTLGYPGVKFVTDIIMA